MPWLHKRSELANFLLARQPQQGHAPKPTTLIPVNMWSVTV